MFKVTLVLMVDKESRVCVDLQDKPVLADRQVSPEIPESEACPERKAALDPSDPLVREAPLGHPDSQPRTVWPANVDPMDDQENGTITLEPVQSYSLNQDNPCILISSKAASLT